MSKKFAESLFENVREDDFVEYLIFPKVENPNENGREEYLEEIWNKCTMITNRLIGDYLWHKDSFKLTIKSSNKSEEISWPHLHGVTHFGENIEDEWFIVYVLKELSKQIPHLIIRVIDADGEFPLIEVADFLPDWANPKTAEYRVYLHKDKLHLIGPEMVAIDKSIDVNEGLQIIFDNPAKTQADIDIQKAFSARTDVYPSKVKDNFHTARCYLPIGAAFVLRRSPHLISAIVRAFCNRDIIDTKACRAMKYFPPENRVYTNVKFTKCLYAMMHNSKYIPDRRTGWNLPDAKNSSFSHHLLGVKIACGLEILTSQAKPGLDFATDKSWNNYVKSLNDKNYFQGYLEHSRDYNVLLDKAREYYLTHLENSVWTLPRIGQQILELLKDVECNADSFNDETLPEEDNDDWLNINPDELDAFLQQKYGRSNVQRFDDNSNPSQFGQQLSTFLNRVSDVEGVEFPQNNRVNFDPNSFSCAVQNILNFAIPEDDWDSDDSDMGDYENDDFVEEKSKMKNYMAEMDKELAGTTVGDSFVKKDKEDFGDVECFTPVDIDMNALKNIIESYKSQLGDAGPSTNLLGSMDIHLDVSQDKS